MKKQYAIEVRRFRLHGENPAAKTYKGIVEQLSGIFSYTLLCGNSRNPKVNRAPKTIASLVTNLNRAAESNCTHYVSEFYSEVK